MSKSNTVRIEVNDVLEELKQENNRLSKQLLFAEKCLKLFEKFRNCLNSFNNNCKCMTNCNNRLIYNDLDNQYKCISDQHEKQMANNVKKIDENFKQFNKSLLNKLEVNKRIKRPKIKPKIKLKIINDSDHNHNNDSNEESANRRFDANEDLLNSSLNKDHIKSGFDSHYSMTRHKNTNKISYYFCNYNYCEFKCTLKEKIERHIKKYHINKTLINCNECDQLFWTHKQMINHIKESHEQIFDKSSQKFKCTYNQCKCQFNLYNRLLIHRNRHFGEKSFKCSDDYPSCKWTFFTLGELRNHQLWSHNTEKPFVCDWNGCGQQFKLRNLLESHKLLHTGQQPFRCEWPGCEMTFLRKRALDVHRSSHIGLKTFRCDWPECGHMYRTNGNLKLHYYTHTNQKPYACEWPGCDARFTSNSSLTRHKSVHKVEAEFACYWPQCGKRFKAKGSLKVHIMSHKGEKPFKCEAIGCDMRFVDRRQMRKHFKRRHTPK